IEALGGLRRGVPLTRTRIAAHTCAPTSGQRGAFFSNALNFFRSAEGSRWASERERDLRCVMEAPRDTASFSRDGLPGLNPRSWGTRFSCLCGAIGKGLAEATRRAIGRSAAPAQRRALYWEVRPC